MLLFFGFNLSCRSCYGLRFYLNLCCLLFEIGAVPSSNELLKVTFLREVLILRELEGEQSGCCSPSQVCVSKRGAGYNEYKLDGDLLRNLYYRTYLPMRCIVPGWYEGEMQKMGETLASASLRSENSQIVHSA